jgi:hypothetical protein
MNNVVKMVSAQNGVNGAIQKTMTEVPIDINHGFLMMVP